MSEVKRVGDLDINQDAYSFEREARAEDVGRIVIWGLVVLALLGVSGTGPLAWASAGAEGDRSSLQATPGWQREPPPPRLLAPSSHPARLALSCPPRFLLVAR